MMNKDRPNFDATSDSLDLNLSTPATDENGGGEEGKRYHSV